jgi:hypothetical protein
MENLIFTSLCGGAGGLIRAIVGTLKAIRRGDEFRLGYFFLTLVIAGILGVFSGLIFGKDFRIALLAGYAGTDLIEGAVKAIKKTNRLFGN